MAENFSDVIAMLYVLVVLSWLTCDP